MTNISFPQKVELIKKDIYNTKFSDLERNGYLYPFLMVSSNLSTFLPQLKNDDHFEIIQNMQFHRTLSGIDLLYPSLLENTKIYDKSKVLEKCYKQGHIFVSYHAGAYNMMLRYLAEKNVDFCVVANNDYVKEYEIIVQQLYKDLPNTKNNSLKILPAEDPKLLLKLTKILREGFSVFIFIDGNSGTKQNNFENDKNLLKINFLEHHIYARQGIAYLSYLSKAPIATILAKRDKKLNNSVKVSLIETHSLIQKHKRDDFVKIITKKVYKELEKFVLKNYEQWSGWFHIHELFDTDMLAKDNNYTTTNSAKVIGNKYELIESIHLIKQDDDHIFLINKRNYEIMRIENFLFDVLNYFKTPQIMLENETFIINDEVIGLDFLTELIDINFLKLS